MPDLGHELLFGSFVTPTSADPGRVVALGRLSEQAGLDLLTVQDHPYQPALLDAWTLLSYLAAVTSRIRLAPNVLNLPLRPPVVAARSAAALDLLSGGRVELGLGAGAFWDAIEASGGRRLDPGDSVAALDEAIQVIRAVWAADVRGGVRVDGAHYRIAGAKRGPAPAHDIGIWVGAYKPRMLRLTGRAADGWLPSLSYLENGFADLARLNRLVDEGAEAAGRPASAIRRLLNVNGRFAASGRGPLDGPPEQWAEQLATVALADGISAFVLASDDPTDLQIFGQEVAPAVRELVETERTAPSVPAPAGRPEISSGRPTHRAQSAQSAHPTHPATGSAAFTPRPTPPPDTQYADHVAWDESTRPVAPPAPAGHVYTDQALLVGAHLIEVHDHLRAELDQLRGVLDQVRAGSAGVAQARAALNEMTMRQNNWTLGAYCASYCRLVTVHHGLEDASIFPHLRAADAGLTPVVDRLESEHHVIHGLVDAVDRALVEFVAAPDDFAGIQTAVDELTDALLSHLSYEEAQIIEPIARYGFYTGQV